MISTFIVCCVVAALYIPFWKRHEADMAEDMVFNLPWGYFVIWVVPRYKSAVKQVLREVLERVDDTLYCLDHKDADELDILNDKLRLVPKTNKEIVNKVFKQLHARCGLVRWEYRRYSQEKYFSYKPKGILAERRSKHDTISL